MSERDPRVDAYIAKSADFAQPILRYLREAIHEACPEVREVIKWRMPYFDYHGVLCGIAAFKAHCAFVLWKGQLILGDTPKAQQAMGSFGRISKLSDLPSKRQLKSCIRAAMKLNEAGVKAPRIKMALKAKASRKARAFPPPIKLRLGSARR